MTIPQIPAFNQGTHDKVMPFLTSFDQNVQSFSRSGTHTEVARIRKTSAVALVVLALGAAYAYKIAHRYVAAGLGALALVSLLKIQYKERKPTKDFRTFSENCVQAAAHLRNAFTAKSNYLINAYKTTPPSNSTQPESDVLSNDSQASDLYKKWEEQAIQNYARDESTIENEQADQNKWRTISKELQDALGPVSYAVRKDISKELEETVAKLKKASEIFLKGKSSDEVGAITYLRYENSKVSVWPSAQEKV